MSDEKQEKPKGRKVVVAIGDQIEEFVGDLGQRISNIVEAAGVGNRDNVVMVRVSDEALEKMDDLVEAEIFKSRSESAAFLIQAGIESQQALFARIREKVAAIRRLKNDLRKIAGQPPGGQ